LYLNLFTIFVFNPIFGQNFPVDTTLNYTSLPLRAIPIPDAHSYSFSVEQLGTANILEKESASNVLLVSDLSWNQSYRWRYTAFDALGKELYRSSDFRFLIKGNSRTDQSRQKVKIIPHPGSHSGGYIFLDHATSAIDRDGNFAWYLPENPLWDGQWERLRDIRMTGQGTVTFIHEGKGLFETDLSGNVLWTIDSPVKDTAMSKRYFHHEFFRAGDSYFVLAMEWVNKQFAGDTAAQSVPYDQILEYDRAGKVVWKWDSQDYFIDEEFIALRNPGKLTPGQGHMNSLSVSPDGKYLYGGFRNISRVLKIRKKNGKVVKSYGQKILPGRAEVGHSWFRRQHNATILPGGRILVFNNDSVVDRSLSSSLVIFDEKAKNDTDGLLWRFDLKFDTLSDARCTQTGSAEELPNGNILTGMGTVNRILEVTPEKEVVWDGFIVRKNPMDKDKWDPFPQYRVHFSPTLWPVLFSIQISGSTQPTIQIRNEGTAGDEYTIEVKSVNLKEVRIIKTKTVLPGHHSEYKLPLDLKEGMVLKVFSGKNNMISQTFTYPPQQ
jgi:hypothetical protein